MEYVYAALMLHEAKKEINEGNVKKVLTAAGVKADDSKIKALVASLEGVDINDALSKAAVAPTPAAAPAAPAEGKADEKKEEAPAEEGKTEEEAAEGLSSLFG